MSFIIHRKPPYRVYVEEGPGGAMAHVAELPGCFATATDAPRAVAAAPAAISAFLAWLRSHGEPLVPEAHVSRPTMADLFVAHIRREGAPTIPGSRAALFEFDKAPWDDQMLERTLRWLSYSRADLLALISDLSNTDLDALQIAPGRTLRQTLWHVANAEYGYVLHMAGPLYGEDAITDTEPEDVRERLAVVRAILERRARAIPREERAAVVFTTWSADLDEPWTLPKALRRAIEHEREHTAEVRGSAAARQGPG